MSNDLKSLKQLMCAHQGDNCVWLTLAVLLLSILDALWFASNKPKRPSVYAGRWSLTFLILQSWQNNLSDWDPFH